MGYKLVRLRDGHYALEFQPDELAKVAAAIRNLYGEVQTARHVLTMTYHIGEATLVFQVEWNDPCLVSGSEIGDEVLSKLYDQLTRNVS